ncbi:RNA polymerase subunit sigma-24 [Xylanibacillus composti]|uniref:RNA polymerase sigma factor n=1 Tax=Xylanibacillus composti TaxID=1572762 RepID=A0A8J4M466_9BACL|nr:sigma-70 family RNA polymerase sigma factor [Xylanibacillus composti]MDT9724623.1 RNA polymerase subunit sigma-24 [Xylanibacillus composti]GIQ70236.1 RNA polymerase sigma factor [Xylanibacillus composti]
MGGQSDTNLLEGIAKGSGAAFSRLYERYNGMVMRIAWQVTKDWSEAEDVCHDVFIEVLRKAGQYDPSRGSIEAWLKVLARCRAKDRLRKRNRFVPLADWEDSSVPVWFSVPESVELRVLQRLEAERVKRELDQIPDLQRAAVYGKYVATLSHKELAASLKRPVGTVKSLIRYGVRNVRKRLELTGSLAMRKSV